MRSCGQNDDIALSLSLGTIRTLLMGRDIEMDRINRLTMDDSRWKKADV